MSQDIPDDLKPIPGRAMTKIKATDAKLTAWIDSWNPYQVDRLRQQSLKPVEIEESEIRKAASKYFLIFFAIFILWAVIAPIDAGVTVQGTVSVLGNRKTVQHPTGGVVEEILVKDGSDVNQGDVLVRVNPLKSEAELTGIELQYINLLATESRLKAERDGSAIQWAPELTKNFNPNDPRVTEAKHLQTKLLDSRRSEYNSQVSGLNEQINGMTKVMEAYRIQIKSLDEEMTSTRSLAKDGFVPKAQANLAERQKSDLDSRMASTSADIARVRTQISQVRGAMLKDIDTQLQELQKNRDFLLSRLDATKFDRELSEIKAPVAGSVVGLKVFTVGGVITAGQPLMDIVPKDEVLIVQAKVTPQIIDKVRAGMQAELRFVAFNQSTTPSVPGIVKVIAADKTKGENAGEEFYLAEVETTKEGIEKLGGLKIQPGMPVDVVIKAGERTFMSYLLKPLSDKLARAFKD
jgi:protease secretion system membrane fusion protein